MTDGSESVRVELEKDVAARKWERMFRLLSLFKGERGHCGVPVHNKAFKGLLAWMAVQRTARKDGVLQEDYVRRLEELGFDWSVRGVVGEEVVEVAWQEKRWDLWFEELMRFKAQEGHCDVPNHSREFAPLAAWVSRQRWLKKKGTLDAERIRRLEEVGFTWSSAQSMIDRRWNAMFEELLRYRERFGNCLVPSRWSENPRLAGWVENQRGFRRVGKLSEVRVRKLDEVGFAWLSVVRRHHVSATSWSRRLVQLRAFKKRFGHCEVLVTWGENPLLGNWVCRQRSLNRDGLLDAKRRARLDALGFMWEKPQRGRDDKWERRFLQLVAFKEKFGHCRVPSHWAEDAAFAHWIENQRIQNRNGILRADRMRRLDELGMIWNLSVISSSGGRAGLWDHRCAELLAFKERFGHFDVPVGWKVNQKLSKWVEHQRTELQKGTMRAERRARLLEMGFPLERSHSFLKDLWEVRFAELVAFREKFGHCRVPAGWKENVSLGSWVSIQRAYRLRGKLSEERVRRLDDLGFVWKPQGRGWKLNKRMG